MGGGRLVAVNASVGSGVSVIGSGVNVGTVGVAVGSSKTTVAPLG